MPGCLIFLIFSMPEGRFRPVKGDGDEIWLAIENLDQHGGKTVNGVGSDPGRCPHGVGEGVKSPVSERIPIDQDHLFISGHKGIIRDRRSKGKSLNPLKFQGKPPDNHLELYNPVKRRIESYVKGFQM